MRICVRARCGSFSNSHVGYEAALGHNPGQSVHAVIHSLSALVRYPLPGRFQPYLSAGYGMMMVFPGQSLNADPVTKNALAIGGGLEFYIRSDVAVRAEMRHATVFGKEKGRKATSHTTTCRRRSESPSTARSGRNAQHPLEFMTTTC